MIRRIPGPWALPAIGGLALAGGRFLLPDLPWSFLATGWAVVAASVIFAAIRWNRISPALPWVLFGGAILACGGGFALAGLVPSDSGDAQLGFHLLAHLAGAAGLVVLARLYASGDPDTWVDAATIGLVAGLASWELVLAPLPPGSLSTPPPLVILLASADAAIAVGLARMVLWPIAPRSFTATGALLGVAVVVDAAYYVGAGSGLVSRMAFEAAWMAAHGAWASAALHPVACRLLPTGRFGITAPPPGIERSYRSVLLVGVALVAVIGLTWHHLRGHLPGDEILGLGLLALAFLVTVRMARIVRRLARDMRGLSRAEAALATSEQRFRALARLAPVGIFETSRGGQSIFQNAYWEELTGFDQERGMGRGWEKTIHPDDAWVPAAFDAGLRTGEPFTLEHRHLRPDGQVRWVTSNVSPVRDDGGEITGWIGTTLDITRLTHERRVALEREAFVNALVEQSPVGIQVFSPTGEPIARNPAEQILLGLTDERPWETMAAPEVDEVTRASVTRALAGYTVALPPRRLDLDRLHRATARGRDPLGRTEVWVKETYFPVKDDAGGVQAVISFSEDVTAPVMADQSRRTIEAKLQESARLEALGVLAGGIAHDFNNLLVAILGHAGLARAEHAAGLDPAADIAAVETAAHRAADLARQMLAYSGRGSFVVGSIRMGAVLDEMGDLLGRSIAKNATLRREFARDLPPIMGDATQLRQVALNLIVNASDALHGEPGTITLRTGFVDLASDDPEVVPGMDAHPGRYVAFEVADTGSGMDPTTMRRIFDPFFTTKSAGRGLGLAATLGIVKGHGGVLRVRTAPGKGTRFQVLLRPAGREALAMINPEPLVRGSEAEADSPFVGAEHEPVTPSLDAPAVAPAATPGDGVPPSRRILIVDDEDSVRRLSRRVLERAGFVVVEARDGAEAIEIFRADPTGFRGVLLDLTLPTLDGMTVLERIRDTSALVPVVLSSGWAAEEVAERLIAYPEVRFLQKPYTAEALSGVFE